MQKALVTTGLSIPLHIALDADVGKMYWADYGINKIQRANLDGSNIEDVLTAGTVTNPCGVAIIPGPAPLPFGDANGDGVVSGDDYGSVQFHFGNVYLEPGGPGDANYDGMVSADDYAIVQLLFGTIYGGVPVPEPATLSLL